MRIELILNNRKEAEEVLQALTIQNDIANDTVLEELYLTPEEVRDLAYQSDDAIKFRLESLRDQINARIDSIQLSDRLINRLRAAIFKAETHS